MAITASAQFPNPLLYYRFDEAVGATSTIDSSGNDLTGTVVGSVNFGLAGAPGGASPGGAGEFSMGGTGIVDVLGLDVPSMLGKRDGTVEQADLNYTIAAWIKPTATSLAGDHFFVGQTTQGIHNGLRDNGRLHQAHWNNDHYGEGPLNDTDWVHATFVYDGVNNIGTIYKDGVQNGLAEAKDGPNGSGNLIVGARQGSTNNGTGESHYTGLIDDFVVFQEILTQEQITALAAGASPIDTEDTDGDNLPDFYERSITGGNDLTILNGDGIADADGDGISDFEEFDETKTNPILADTDTDGIDDGDELAGNNATGTSSGFGATDPLKIDTDADGLGDNEELDSANGFVTNPNSGDTDMDGSTDKYEIDNSFDPTSDASKPEVLTIQPSFAPINPLPATYVPGDAGWEFQENFYNPGVILNNAASGNYVVHTTSLPVANSSSTSIQPYLDHGVGGDTISANNLAFPAGGGDNFTVRANAFVQFTQGGNYVIHHGADDTTYTVMDLGGAAPVIAENNCCPQDVGKSITVGAPGFYPFDFVFGEQGGGEWLDIGISGEGITGTVALGDVANGSPAVFVMTFPAGDIDGDGLPDAYEEAYFPGDLSQLGSGDFDEDGSSDVDEFANGTNPTVMDTDMDGLTDGEEAALGTNPLDADSDDDTISDGDEVGTENGSQTNPLLADTDADGFPDPIEILLGSDPDDVNSVPGAARLPIIDDFEDGIFNTVFWKTALDTEPGGASVTEIGGAMRMVQRGHLVTMEEYDPEEVGGLCIAGEWTLVSGDDFIQILTRSDATPAGQYGETNSGVEFFANGIDNGVAIRARNADHTVDEALVDGAVTLTAGTTYAFLVIDDGEGNLSFTLEEVGNAANAVSLTSQVTTSNSAANFIAFHNREGAGRTGDLESVTIKSLTGPDQSFQITTLDFDLDAGMFSLTWDSIEGEVYRISYSTNLEDWLGDVADGIDAAVGEVTTTASFERADIFGIPVDAPRIFFRVENVTEE